MSLSLTEAHEAHDAQSAEHIVQFYDTDDFLVDVLADFVANGLAAGQAAVVIATEEHRRSLVARLEPRDLDLAGAIASGRVSLLDARATLATFMVGDTPDWDRFKQAIEPVLEAARSSGPDARPLGLRAYGEMPDVLWRSGNPAGALLLEEMWNDLREEDSFTLLCAYVVTNFHDETHGLHRACSSHNRVHPPQHAEGSRHAGTDGLATEIRQRILLECALRDSVNDLQRTQHALDRSERSMRDFVDNATVGLQWVGADGTVQWANRAVFELLGYDRSEYLGQPLARFHAEPDVVDELLARLAAGEPVRGHETRMLARDGSLRHVLVSASYHHEGGRFVEGRFSIHDISARKQADEAVRASERRLQDITDTLPVLVACIDTSERYQFVNAPYHHWFGRPGAAILGHPVREILGDRLYALVRPHLAAALGGATVQFQACMPFPAGDRHVEATYLPRRDADGRVVGVVGLVTDISERKRHDDARDANQRRTQRVLGFTAAIADAMTREQVFGVVVDQVAAAVGAVGAVLWLVEGDALRMARCFSDPAEVTRRLAAIALVTPGSLPVLDCIRRGEPIWIDSRDELRARYPQLADEVATEGFARLACVPVVFQGTPLGAIACAFDHPSALADQEERTFLLVVAGYAAHALERLRLLDAERTSHFDLVEELRAIVRFNEMFTGILGHDLRNPLTGIVTAAQSAMLTNDNEGLVRPLTRIVASSERMGRMINQLLDFTRLRLGAGMPLLRRPLDLEPLVREVMDELDDANPAWTLRVEHTGDTVGTWDGDRLAQVFSNLIANALQHGSATDGVVVRLDGTAPDQLRAEVHNAGTIPDQLVPRLFDALVGGNRVDKSGGLGLGLYITREIVTAHGGTIDVETDPARGTTFVVRLPRAVAPAPPG